MRHSLDYLTTRPWAITERCMDTIFSALNREPDLEAVAAKLGRPLENTGNRVEQRGGTAVLTVEGPLFRYANLFTAISGATSVELLGRDLHTALNDPQVESILLNVNSPGGEADGISELAGMIYEGRSRKPVWAYVGGWAASGGYWLASAAERIVMHRSAFGGSIGVIATITDDRKRRERDGYVKHEIVSSQSPLKRADPDTDEGLGVLKEMVDSMAALFIEDVAQYRGTTAENVQQNFGRGFVIDAARALRVGMADDTGTYEGVIAQLNGDTATGRKTLAIAAAATDAREEPMAEEKQPDVNALRGEAAAAERARINAILGCEEAKGREKLARHLALETDMAPEAARGILAASEPLAAAPEPKTEDQSGQFAEHMRKVANPKVGVQSEEVDDVAREVAAIAAFIPAANRRRAS